MQHHLAGFEEPKDTGSGMLSDLSAVELDGRRAAS
jgi:hypothetical protein